MRNFCKLNLPVSDSRFGCELNLEGFLTIPDGVDFDEKAFFELWLYLIPGILRFCSSLSDCSEDACACND